MEKGKLTKKNSTILVADDDPDILNAIQLILETEGYDVKTTEDGGTVQEIANDRPDLVLLDIRMSGYDGRKICCDLKTKGATKDIPIIIISANHDVKASAIKCGANDFLSKPFDMDQLLKKVEIHLGS